jgi:hypothetical protein
MSEIMLHGVLNMPAELWDSSNPFDSMQRQPRYFEASKLIYKQADRIAELDKTLKEAREICDAVAHVGVDFGYGIYTLEDSIIHRARLLLEALKEQE